MLKVLLFVVAGLPAFLFTYSAQAEEDSVPAALQRKYDQRMVFMAPYDANQDKILQREEQRAMVIGQFKRADSDADGSLSQGEQQGLLGGFVEDNQETYGAFAERRAKQLKNRLHNADSNEDGMVSKAEYYNYFGRRYSAMDKNGDGSLTVQEFRTDTETRGRR